jgi:FkbM family methyltransferase
MPNLANRPWDVSSSNKSSEAKEPKATLGAYAKARCGNLLMACLGRRSLARTARWLTNTARLDVVNDMRINGESLVQELVLRNYPRDRDVVVFDVGANVGDWSTQLVRICDSNNRERRFLYAFEPVSSTMEMFRHRVGGLQSGWHVVAVQKGLSDRKGDYQISVIEEGCGINAITPDPKQKPKRIEVIELTTVDAYSDENNISEIGLLKIDAEGHDLFVLRGARLMLEQKRIAVVQFEYNFRWTWSRVTLFDVFEYGSEVGYHVGKVTPRGIEFYEQWDPELEKFVEGNYLLCREDWVEKFPRVLWWKAN